MHAAPPPTQPQHPHPTPHTHPQGVQLEALYGSLLFGALVGWLALASGVAHVGLAYTLAHNWRQYRSLYYANCAVGFSGVLFALKVGRPERPLPLPAACPGA